VDRGSRQQSGAAECILVPERNRAMADVGLIVLTVLLFGLLALAVKGVERL
jgi:hypothetical protein